MLDGYLTCGAKWGRRDADISLSDVVGSCVGCCGMLVLVVPEVYVLRILELPYVDVYVVSARCIHVRWPRWDCMQVAGESE